jgi:hypothetical protein
MTYATPVAEDSHEIVLPDHLQLLLGCLLLGLLFCGSIAVYTNHVREAAAILAQLPDSGSSSNATMPPASIESPGVRENSSPIVQSQSSDGFLKVKQNKPAVANLTRKSPPALRGGDAIALQTRAIHRRIARTLVGKPATSRVERSHPTPPVGWFRTNLPRHSKTALIEVWRQTHKPRQ